LHRDGRHSSNMNVASSRAHSPGKAIGGWACPARTGASRSTARPPGTHSRARNAGPACARRAPDGLLLPSVTCRPNR